MTTETLDTQTKSRPSLADELHRVADWIHEHDAAQDVCLVAFPPISHPRRPFKVVFHTVGSMRRLLPGVPAKRTRHHGETSYLATHDEITFQVSEYVRDTSEPIADEITL